MSSSTEYTRTLCDFLCQTTYENLPRSATEKAKLFLLDYIGYAARSIDEEPARILRKIVTGLGGRPEASVIGWRERTSCAWAALLNGAMGHMTELDDTHRGTQSHPGDSILAAALAAGERAGTDGRTFLASVVAGYECAIRAGEAAMPTHYTRGWHPSGTINTFGAAAAAAKIFGLSGDGFLFAQGLAGTMTAGNFAHIGMRGMAKDLNPGKGAFNGLLAALLAEEGFTGARDIFENPKGFLALYSDSPHPERLISELGDSFCIEGVAHKPFPGCRHLHPARDAALEIARENGLSAEDVAGVTARIFSIGAQYVDDPVPWEGEKGHYGPRFSAQFQVALALCEGERGLWDSFEDAYVERKLEDPRIRETMARIEVVHDKDLDRGWPEGWCTVVELETRAGARHSLRIDLPKGEPENPMSEKDIVAKFETLSATAFSVGRIAEIREAVGRLEEMEDVRALGALVCGEPA